MPRTLPAPPASTTDPAAVPHLTLLARQFRLVLPDEEKIDKACARLRELLTESPAAASGVVPSLAHLVTAAEGLTPLSVVELLMDSVPLLADPWPVLETILMAEEEAVGSRALVTASRLLREGRLPYDVPVRRGLASAIAAAPGLLEDPSTVRRLAAGLRQALPARRRGDMDPLVRRFAMTDDALERRFLAHVLDASGTRGALKAGAVLFAADIWRVLRTYLAFTGAGFRDLDAVISGRGGAATAATLKAAEQRGGACAVRAVLSASGWERFNLGLRITSYRVVEAPGSLPLPLPVDEALVFKGVRGVSVGSEFLIAELHGCGGGASAGAGSRDDPVDRFRSLNLVHAELLAEFMDMAPLDAARVSRILAAMDIIVREYAALFGRMTREARILPDVYAELRAKVEAAVAEGGEVSVEAARLVLMFEDPRNLGEVRTVHALKRYLHQKGLELGLKLVDTSRSPSHTVDLLRLTPDGVVVAACALSYAAFEAPSERDAEPRLTRPVALVGEAFRHQLLHGQNLFPDVSVFVFGNEAHYLIAFRNHPAFLRIDYSPPRRGGMIDLSYLGVSNYELDAHPAFDLEAIQIVFRRLGFDVKKDGISLKVRYDKEACADLGDLEAKAVSLFRLAPHLMSVDWAVGSLDMPDAAKDLAAKAWAERFAATGAFPLGDVVTTDGRAVVIGRGRGPSGPTVKTWDGGAPYVDRYSAPWPRELLETLAGRLADLGVECFAPGDEVPETGELALRRRIFVPLRRALDDGRVSVADGELRRTPSELCVRESAPETFARLLAGKGRVVRETVAAVGVVSALEPHVSLETVGAVGGLEIQSGQLQVRGGPLFVHVARDQHGVVRSGYLTTDVRLTRRRNGRGKRWNDGLLTGEALYRAVLAVDELASLPEAAMIDAAATLAELRFLASRPLPSLARTDAGDVRLLRGRSASPGRVMGQAVFGEEDTPPERLEGAVLFTRHLRPDDAPRLMQAAGFVSAGGSLLSHACLMALQFGKPALLVEAEYRGGGRRRRSLRFTTPIYRIERLRRNGFDVELRRIASLCHDEICEGDLVILDADAEGVVVLGQERDALALADGMRMLNEAGRSSAVRESAADLMEARGLKLRARYLLEKTLDRLHDPALARFAVDEFAVGRSCRQVGAPDRLHLLERLFSNVHVGNQARERLHVVAGLLDERLGRAVRAALERIPVSESPCEILSLRLRMLDERDTLAAAEGVAAGFGLASATVAVPPEVETGARVRLEAIRDKAVRDLEAATPTRARHLLRRIGVLDAVLGGGGRELAGAAKARRRQERQDASALAATADRLVLSAAECGHGLHPWIGWKAANLAEMSRILGHDVSPPWFVVTDAALSRMMAGSVGAENGALAGAIREVLSEPALTSAERSRRIRELWRRAPLPQDLTLEVERAYRRLTAQGCDVVALRSSFCDEDTETTARAGQYDSFLQVRGVDSVLEHLRLAWAGLWSERALATGDRLCGSGVRPGGGVLVQMMVEARCSGVLQTVDVARDEHRSMVATVGLGLGEGVVSGIVATDLVTIAKNTDPNDRVLRIHYVTNDKTTQVVADLRRSGGTRIAPTLYHQRLRPAMEYLELTELATMALDLEGAFGYPLDLEFAVAGLRVWLLQARPIGAHAAVLRETTERRPLAP